MRKATNRSTLVCLCKCLAFIFLFLILSAWSIFWWPLLRTQAPGIKLRSYRLWRSRAFPGLRWVAGIWRALPPFLSPFLLCQSLHLGAEGSLREGWFGGGWRFRQGSPFCGLLPTTALLRSENQEEQASLTWADCSPAQVCPRPLSQHSNEKWCDSSPLSVHTMLGKKNQVPFTKISVLSIKIELQQVTATGGSNTSCAGCRSRQLHPTSPQQILYWRHVSRLICKASKTWTLWTVAIGWRI